MLRSMGRLELANFNLNLLLALDGLLGARSVTGAARRVRVTPSAMSHSLAELRSLLGDPLLVRSGRAMVLTPRAQALVGPLHKLLADTERLLRGGSAFDPRSAERAPAQAARFLGDGNAVGACDGPPVSLATMTSSMRP